MKFKKIDDKIFFRMEKDEEIIETLKNFCKENMVRLAKVEAIGATNKVTLGLFKTVEKQYLTHEYSGDFEVISMLGNISEKDGEVYLHCHMAIADETGNMYGGHLSSAVVSATLEGVISLSDGQIDRYMDDEIGLNLWKIDK